MTKNERIKKLEEQVALLIARVESLEARSYPPMPQYSPPLPYWQNPVLSYDKDFSLGITSFELTPGTPVYT